MKLQEVLMEANAGCIMNRETIKRVVDDLMNLNVYELIHAMDEDFSCIGDLISEHLELDISCLKVMKYSDVLCITYREWEDDSKEYNEDCGDINFRYVLIWCVYYLIKNNAEINACVNLFFSLNRGEFLEYMQKLGEEKKGYSHFLKNQSFYYDISKILDLDKWGSCTIGGIISSIGKRFYKHWMPWTDKDEYCSEIYKAYWTAYVLLVEAFERAFPEYFRYEEIYKKCKQYTDNEKEEISCQTY